MQAPKLLIPLDGSEFSRTILPYIRNVFRPGSFAICLLRVTKPPTVPMSVPPRPVMVGNEYFDTPSEPPSYQPAHPVYPAQVEDNLSTKLKSEMQQAAQFLEEAGFTVSREVRFGDPTKEILKFVEQEGVSLVAMATHGRTGLGRLLMGSIAETVLRRLSLPVLLFHPIEVTEKDSHDLNWNDVYDQWEDYSDQAKQTWGRLTDADLEWIDGRHARLVSKLQEAYGTHSFESAEEEAERWRLDL